MTAEPVKTLADYSIQDFMELIDTEFEEHVGKIGRLNVEWGIWSRDMNVEIRYRMTNIQDNDMQIALGLVFSYWTTVSQLLDLLNEDGKGVIEKLFLSRKVKNKTNEAIAIRKQAIKAHDEYIRYNS